MAVTVDEALLGLKVAFLVLLYLFVWLVVRSATRGLSAGAPQESIVIPAADAPLFVPPAGSAPRGASSCCEPGARSRAPRSSSRTAPRGRAARERDPARCRHDRLEPPRDDRQPDRRPLGRGRGLDERHVRERRAV
jgi:hypothetical protein